MPAKNVQFLPSETSKFCIETSVCPVVTKSSKTMMLRCGGMLLAVKTVPTRCFEGAKAQSSKNGKPSCSAMRIAMSVAKLRSLWRRFGVVTTAKSSGERNEPRTERISGVMLSAKKPTISSSPLMSVRVRPYTDFFQSVMKNTPPRLVIRILFGAKSQRASATSSSFHALRFFSSNKSFDLSETKRAPSSGTSSDGTSMSFNISSKAIAPGLAFCSIIFTMSCRSSRFRRPPFR